MARRADLDLSPTFRVLGSVEAGTRSTSLAPLAGPKQRAILGLLASEVGRIVATDRLIDAIWGEAPPAAVRSALQVNISQIRKALDDVGLVDLLVTRAPGYVLDVAPEDVDLHRFDALHAAAARAHRNGDLLRSGAGAHEALTLWRGHPFADTGDAPYARVIGPIYEQHRLELVEMVADAELAAGEPPTMIAELEVLVHEHPYRETLWERLALQLYRTGRQADAHRRLTALRRILRTELGLEPTPRIVALELAMLDHDIALAGPAGSRATDAGQLPGLACPACARAWTMAS